MLCVTGDIQNCPRLLAMQSCALCLHLRYGTSKSNAKNKNKKQTKKQSDDNCFLLRHMSRGTTQPVPP